MHTPKKRFYKRKWFIVSAVVAVILVAWAILARRGGAQYQFVSVTRGPIIETVSVTGNTTPVQSVTLGFQTAGVISRVYKALGDSVSAGDVVASLDTADLSAQYSQAKAALDAAQATLDGLKAGSRPEDIAASAAALDKSRQDLSNLYSSISDSANDAYSKANDAVRTQLNPFFSNAESQQPQLTFQTSDSQAGTDVIGLRAAATMELNAWQSELAGVSSSSATSTLSNLLANSLSHLKAVQALLSRTSAALNGAVNLSSTQLVTDRANLTVAVTEANAATTALNSISQNIASQNALVAQAAAQLALKQAGATAEDIAAQQATVEQAAAAAASVAAKLQNARIVAPMSGVITQEDAKVGQVATIGAPLVSIISDGAFEVDAYVPETDVGKVAVGDPVSMTLDAFQGETFTGKVFYINPAQTLSQGVVDYEVKVSFDKPDKRIRSGFTVNLDIQTNEHADALILPEYALVQNDQGTFVQVVENGKAVEKPVTVGLRDGKGNAEIVSGVSEGEQVVNVGLRAPGN